MTDIHRRCVALAVLDIEAGLYDDAAKRLEKALNHDSSDGLSWFFLGVSRLRDKRENEALRCAFQAARCFGTASLGYDLAGRAYMRLKDYSKAAEAFEKAVQLNPRDTLARNHLLLALYAAGNERSAYKQAKERIMQNPTDLVPRALIALESKKEMDRFVRESRSFVGEDEFEMLQTSLVFAELGLVDEAARILLAACVEAVPPGERSPLPLYYLAYFSSLKEDRTSARKYISQAAATYRDYVFPSGLRRWKCSDMPSRKIPAMRVHICISETFMRIWVGLKKPSIIGKRPASLILP